MHSQILLFRYPDVTESSDEPEKFERYRLNCLSNHLIYFDSNITSSIYRLSVVCYSFFVFEYNKLVRLFSVFPMRNCRVYLTLVVASSNTLVAKRTGQKYTVQPNVPAFDPRSSYLSVRYSLDSIGICELIA